MLRRVARRVAHVSFRFVVAVWAVSCLALAVALMNRSPIGVANGVGMLAAGVTLSIAYLRSSVLVSFAGFGLAFFATFARFAFSVPVASNWSGAVIITVAWALISFKAAQRMALTYLMLTGGGGRDG